MITILAGPDKQHLGVHEAAFDAVDSPSLKRLISGQWTESKSRVIDWGHTDAATVQRFLTFLYLGNYNTPWPQPRPDLPSPESCEAGEFVKEDPMTGEDVMAIPEVVAHLGTPESEADGLPEEPEPWLEPWLEPEPDEEALAEVDIPDDGTESNPAYQKALLESFDARPLTPIASFVEAEAADYDPRFAAGVFESSEYPYKKYSYIDLLLAHTQVYIFAQYHLCSNLRSFALQRLLEVLQCVDCSQEHAASEIASLAQLVYDRTQQTDSDEEPLRRVVSHFVADNYNFLARSDLEDLFLLGGEFTVDVSKKVARRLRAIQISFEALKQENSNLQEQIRGCIPLEAGPVDDCPPQVPDVSSFGRRNRRR